MKHVLAPIVGIAIALPACSTPVPQLRLALSGSDAQTCPSTDCHKVDLQCPAVMSIKIMDPGKPGSPYLSQCTAVARDGSNDMCSLATVDLGTTPIPVKHLEVQIALYPASEITTNGTTGLLECPEKIDFSSGTGFPIEQASPTMISPALGGVGFYDPGDSVVNVTLGCTDLDAINQSCQVADLVSVSADVLDFQKHTLVTAVDASQLDVFVGEPVGVSDHYELPTTAAHPLMSQTGATSDPNQPASWGDELSLQLQRFACAEVLEPVAQATPTVTCGRLAKPIGLHGAWIRRVQLMQLLTALGSKGFPSTGFTVGMVVDAAGHPVPNATVIAKSQNETPATVMYLSDADDSKLVAGQTGATGIFLSTDAPFGAEFSTSQGAGAPTLLGIGGNIQDVVTVVILSPNGN